MYVYFQGAYILMGVGSRYTGNNMNKIYTMITVRGAKKKK